MTVKELTDYLNKFNHDTKVIIGVMSSKPGDPEFFECKVAHQDDLEPLTLIEEE